MYIHLTDIKLKGYKHICAKDYIINYTIEGKELFKETNDFFVFIDSNYSEAHINNCFTDKLSIENINRYFKKDGFIVVINKNTLESHIQRDLAGLCSGYYFSDVNQFVISSNVHELGQNFSTELNKKHIHQLLYFDFLRDGQTIYENIEQVKIGGTIVLNNKLKIIKNISNEPEINKDENKEGENENIKKLRAEIVKAHKPYVNDLNTVFLSGGIDSVAMLIALDDLTDKQNIENHSFRVKGTTQDETSYAKSIADHLEIDLKIIERDFKNDITESVFIDKILKMNNPYSGMWIFGNQINTESNKTYFAGQDTRLHTPALNKLDQLAFNIFALSKKGLAPLFYILNILLFPIREIMNIILSKKNIHDKKFLGLRRATYMFDTKSYLNLVYFKIDKPYLKTLKLPLNYFDTNVKNYKFDLSTVKNQRMLYNVLVSKKWIEQYVNDMRYMVDMVKTQGGKLAMPFYDMDLAKFSATIPFKLANKSMNGKGQFDDIKVNVNKYVLRKALEDKIDDKTFLRSKAVSRTGHLIFTQGLGGILKSIIKKDLELEKSFIKEYKLEQFIEFFLKNENEWEMTDDKYLLKIYYATCLIVYNKRLNI